MVHFLRIGIPSRWFLPQNTTLTCTLFLNLYLNISSIHITYSLPVFGVFGCSSVLVGVHDQLQVGVAKLVHDFLELALH